MDGAGTGDPGNVCTTRHALSKPINWRRSCNGSRYLELDEAAENT